MRDFFSLLIEYSDKKTLSITWFLLMGILLFFLLVLLFFFLIKCLQIKRAAMWNRLKVYFVRERITLGIKLRLNLTGYRMLTGLRAFTESPFSSTKNSAVHLRRLTFNTGVEWRCWTKNMNLDLVFDGGASRFIWFWAVVVFLVVVFRVAISCVVPWLTACVAVKVSIPSVEISFLKLKISILVAVDM